RSRRLLLGAMQNGEMQRPRQRIERPTESKHAGVTSPQVVSDGQRQGRQQDQRGGLEPWPAQQARKRYRDSDAAHHPGQHRMRFESPRYVSRDLVRAPHEPPAARPREYKRQQREFAFRQAIASLVAESRRRETR